MKVYIISHRRSGTHLTMSILNNYFDGIVVEKQSDHPIFDDIMMTCDRLNNMKTTGKVIHALREPRDVMVSSYYYEQHVSQVHKRSFNMTFSEFLRQKKFISNGPYSSLSRLEYWRHHTESWMIHKDIMHLYFEDSVEQLPKVIAKLEKYLGIKAKAQVLESEKVDAKKSVFFRKGKVGDYQTHFSESDLEYAKSELTKPFNFGHELVCD